jgi:branched-chain amino acid transport system substrate-binding protein
VPHAQPHGPEPAYFGNAYQTDDGDGPVTEYTNAPAAPPANGIPAQ